MFDKINLYRDLQKASNGEFFSFQILMNDKSPSEQPLILIRLIDKSKYFRFTGEESFVIAFMEACDWLNNESLCLTK